MLLRQMNERAQHTYVPSFDIVIIYAGLAESARLLCLLAFLPVSNLEVASTMLFPPCQ
jgi:hypothetical protein